MAYGFRCVISTSFADIFYNNSIKNGLLPAIVEPGDLERLLDEIEAASGLTVTADLAASSLTTSAGSRFGFAIPDHARHALAEGLGRHRDHPPARRRDHRVRGAKPRALSLARLKRRTPAMKLYHSPASPFVRKALVAAHELGLADGIEIVPVAMTPVKGVPALNEENPLGKIPALVLDDGTALYDSPVICEYLDTRHDGAPLFPAEGPERWTALRRQGPRGRTPRRRDPLPLRDLPPSRGTPVGGLDRGTAGEVPARPRRPRRRGGELRRHGRHRHHFGRVRGGLPRLPVARRRLARGAATPCRLARRIRGAPLDAGDAPERLSGGLDPRAPAGRLR